LARPNHHVLDSKRPNTYIVDIRLSRIKRMSLPESFRVKQFEPPYPTDSDPEVAKERWSELERRGVGWKLHLNFDPDDATKRSAVSDLLTDLQDQGDIATFKIGKGGGRADDQPGKEATVYVGPRDKAERIARIIDFALEPVLDAPEGEALKDDIPFGPGKVMGRFDVQTYDLDFAAYGTQGFPLRKVDMNARLFGNLDPEEAKATSENLLIERYGMYYTGTERPLDVAGEA
jgi:hypothetical protein